MSPRVVLLAGLAPLLAGCGIPDLIAHTVKSVEHNQDHPAAASTPAAQPAAAADSAPAPAPSRPVVEDTRTMPPAARSGSITSEALPPPPR
jgi:hypothetical protein